MKLECPCGVMFVPTDPRQKYHAKDCKARKAISQANARRTRAQVGLGTRAATFNVWRAGRKYLLLLQADPPEPYWRPVTRGDCANVPRPCPYVGCRHNLYLDITRTGSLKFNFPHLQPDQMPTSCAIDEAVEHAGLTLEEVGVRLNLTRERARQIEEAVLDKVRASEALGPAS